MSRRDTEVSACAGGADRAKVRGQLAGHSWRRQLAGATAALLALCMTHPAAADDAAPAHSCPQPFKITLDVEWHGMGAGTSTLQLTRNSPTEYTYQSSNTAHGLFRLAIPGTITQVSRMSLVDGKVRPSSYT